MYYIAVDVGCIECGEESHILGVFKTLKRAKQVCDIEEKKQEDNWHGQHYFEVFKLPKISKYYPVKYED